MTHINCRVCLHAQLPAASVLQEQGFWGVVLLLITSKYLKGKKLHNFLSHTLNLTHTCTALLWRKILSLSLSLSLYIYIYISSLTIIIQMIHLMLIKCKKLL